MSNPDNDTDIPSGLNDDAEMERTSTRARQMVISSPEVLLEHLIVAADLVFDLLRRQLRQIGTSTR